MYILILPVPPIPHETLLAAGMELMFDPSPSCQVNFVRLVAWVRERSVTVVRNVLSWRLGALRDGSGTLKDSFALLCFWIFMRRASPRRPRTGH